MNEDEDRGVAVVRKRPGMYVGSLEDGAGLIGLVENAVGSAINEVLAGYASRVGVELCADGSCSVIDDGRGLPTAIEAHHGISRAEFAMTSLHAILHDYAASQCLTDCLCIVTALSAQLDLVIWRDGKEHWMHFRQGNPAAPLRAINDARDKHGTKITFLPDEAIFGDITFDAGRLATRLRELAAQYAVPIDFKAPRTQ